ncbi:MAG: tripartite tricarboxylate transporter substrate binding protein [Pseudomonadota bacterium]
MLLKNLVRSAAIIAAGVMAAHAQDAAYPSRPVTLVVPFPAGGVVDVLGRLVADKLQAALKGTVIVDNKPGAGGTLGAGLVARSRPDGYTVLLGGSATQIFGPVIYPKLSYDASRAFAPIGQISNGPLVVTLGAKMKASNFNEMVAELRNEGSQGNYGSNGNGTFPHLAAELLKHSTGLQTVHVPYIGGPAVVTALLAGDLSMSINHIPVVQGMVKSGKLRAVATTGAQRSAAFPDLPTVAESGVKGFEASAWFGLFAPAGTPAPVVQELTAALELALQDPDLRAKLLAQGDEPAYKAPGAFKGYIASETARWTPIIKNARISVD